MASFEDNIRSWVKIDDQLRESQEHTKQLREKRTELTNTIYNLQPTNNLTNTTVNISDGRLRFCHTTHPQSLTFKFLEECLNEIITEKNSVEQILNHIKGRRTVKSTQEIKRFYSDN